MQDLLKIFQTTLNSFDFEKHSNMLLEDPNGRFAYRRFFSKFEIPSNSDPKGRRESTFREWVRYDASLADIHLPNGNWYRARLKIRSILKHFSLGELTFTNGSSSEPLNGRQSVAHKLLLHKWEISPDCVDLFCSLAVKDHAFVRAAKMRARRSLGAGYREVVSRIFSYRRNPDDVRQYLIRLSLTPREASRWGCVPKNNTIDRAIDLQPFCNMLVQRAIGVGLRQLIRKEFDVDLLTAQDLHRTLISDPRFATIDLKNASDSNTWSLVSFLCPGWFVDLLKSACPPYTEGLDGDYYVTRKVSSMGNGFTFELMTLTLLALVREHDPATYVFGDDIIAPNVVANQILSDLLSAGWVVNEAKSFIDSPFRESCGGNFQDGYGYFRSYDFRYPKTVQDCVTFLNKCFLLREYPLFKELHDILYRLFPIALRGPKPILEIGKAGQPLDPSGFDSWVFSKKSPSFNNPSWFGPYAKNLCWDEWFTHKSLHWSPRISVARRTRLKASRDQMLFLQYLQSGRVSDIVFTGRGDWKTVTMVSNGLHSSRAKSFHS